MVIFSEMLKFNIFVFVLKLLSIFSSDLAFLGYLIFILIYYPTRTLIMSVLLKKTITMKIKILGFLFFAILLNSCVKEGAEVKFHYYDEGDHELMSKYIDIPAYPEDYTLNFPEYYTRGFGGRQFDNGMATLGRVLFYDVNLSSDRTISCASCHKQEIAFSDDLALSKGVQNRSTARNSLALGSTFNFNEYYGNPSFGGIPFFWDNRAFTVSDQSSQTLGNPLEMDMKMHEVVDRVNDLEYYKPLFNKEFFGEINETNVLRSISEFVNALGSFESKFDAALTDHFKSKGNLNNLENYAFASYTESENRGKNIYVNKCASCHSSTFGAPSKIKANNGLEMNYTDNGISDQTGNTFDKGVFKVPTLRNITMTAPYMHDGSISTLKDVIEHYSTGIQNHSNLDPLLKTNGGAMKMNFTQQDKDDLIAFFYTLNDDGLLKNTKFSDPFIN